MSLSIYRSQEASEYEFSKELMSMISLDRATVIAGDFNICFAIRSSNPISSTLKQVGFHQIVNDATHINGGHLDHVYVKEYMKAEVEIYSPYYTAVDHDASCISIGIPDER